MRKQLFERALIFYKIRDAISSAFLFDFITTVYAFIFEPSRRAVISKRIRRGYYARNFVERRKNKKLLEMARANFKEDLEDKPLISVIIPTYNRAKILTERTIPSVLKQTYQNFELIVVGDKCTDNTEALVKNFGDKRIKFYNLPKRGDYPANPLSRWLVAGSVPRNKGLELAKGKWIAHLDDDDEFLIDHLQLLLQYALENYCEFVYGIINQELTIGKWGPVGAYPLREGAICHLSVLYHSKLRFFKYDVNSWKYPEPVDWNLWRRMKEAGVKVGFLNKVVGKHYLEMTTVHNR